MIPDDPILTLEYDGTEKILGEWGLTHDGSQLMLVNQSADTFTSLAALSDLTEAPFIPHGGRVKIYARQKQDAAPYFSAGTGEKVFDGERVTVRNSAQSRGARRSYTFANAWYDLEQRPYLQQRPVKAELNEAEEVVIEYDYTSEIVLFFHIDYATGTSSYLTIGQQIYEILQYAIDRGANFQIGTIDAALYAQAQHTYPCRDIKCAEALQMCLRSCPQAVVAWDYSTATPTVNVLLTRESVSLPYADGVKHLSSNITPRPDLQLDCVLLIFKITNTLNGEPYVYYVRDKYPNEAGLELERATLIQTIDLAGVTANSTSLSAELKTIDNDFASADNATRLNWWKRFKPQFGDGKMLNVTFDNASLTVKDENGLNIDYAGNYPRTIVEASPAEWMSDVNAVRATVSVNYTAKEVDANGFTTKRTTTKNVSTNITLTNAALGTSSYTTTSGGVSSFGEPVPGAAYTGTQVQVDEDGNIVVTDGEKSLAQYIYEQMAGLQHEGTHTIVEGAWTHSVGIENSINLTGDLTGDLAALATMAAQVQRIQITFDSAKVTTEVTMGPAKHLGAGDLTQLFLINRFRNNANLAAITAAQF